MLAYLNKPQLKTMLLEEVAKHRKADQLIKGTYGKENGIWKGCAVGCSIHSLNLKLKKNYETDDHSVYEKELGIPKELAYLEDTIFEELPEKESQEWPEKFLKAIKPGANLSLVVPKFIIWQFEDPDNGLIKTDAKALKNPELMAICVDLVNLYKKIVAGKKVTQEELGRDRNRYTFPRHLWARARAGAFILQADKLIELLKEAN